MNSLLSKRVDRLPITESIDDNEKMSKDWKSYSPLKLHLGCGKRYLKGWYHIDAINHPNVQMSADVSDLSLFPDACVDEIYASHVLEHINRHKVVLVLKEWTRVLKSGGKLRIAVPNFEAVVDHYNEKRDLSILMGLLYGGQDSELNYHYVTFDFEILKSILSDLGFNNIEQYDYRSFLPHGFDDFSKCFLPHMDENNGKLMSLNVVAVKK